MIVVGKKLIESDYSINIVLVNGFDRDCSENKVFLKCRYKHISTAV